MPYKNVEKQLAHSKEYYWANREARMDYARKWNKPFYENLRNKVYTHYGNKCICPKCPETNSAFLTLGHTTKEGKKRDKGRSAQSLLNHIIRLGFPDDIQLECFNCNCGKQYRGSGICPHLL